MARLDHQQKGQDILINAIHFLKRSDQSCICSLVGVGTSYTFLKDLVARLSLGRDIAFLGNRNDVPALLREADLFVLPSRFEGFGIVAIEAMVSGLPVVVSDVDGPGEFIVHAKNGLLFESENALDLAEKITKIMMDSALSKRLAEAGLATAAKYSIETMQTRYLSVYAA